MTTVILCICTLKLLLCNYPSMAVSIVIGWVLFTCTQWAWTWSQSQKASSEMLQRMASNHDLCFSPLFVCPCCCAPVYSCCISDSSGSMCTLPSGVYAFVISNRSVDQYYSSCIHRCFQISPCWNFKDLRLPGAKEKAEKTSLVLCLLQMCPVVDFFGAWQSTEKNKNKIHLWSLNTFPLTVALTLYSFQTPT